MINLQTLCAFHTKWFFCDQDPDRLCILETSRSYDLSPSCIHKLKNTDASIQQYRCVVYLGEYREFPNLCSTASADKYR